MTNTNNKEFLMKRSELIRKLRRKAAAYQATAVVLLILGLILSITLKVKELTNIGLGLLALAGLFFGVCFQISALIYFSKAKKHLSGQTVTASSNPKDWQ